MALCYLTRSQFELLLEMAGDGSGPAQGETKKLRHGIEVANNSDLPAAVASGRGWCADVSSNPGLRIVARIGAVPVMDSDAISGR